MSRTSRSRPGAVPPRPNLRPEPQPSRPKPSPATPGTVPDGLDYNSRVIGTYGTFAGLLPMAAAGLMSALVLWGSQSTVRGVIGFILAVVACPTLPIVGFPISSGVSKWLIAIASSAVLWMILGYVATRRSTKRAVAGWPEWRSEWLRLAVGVWIGSFIGFAIAAILLTVDF